MLATRFACGLTMLTLLSGLGTGSALARPFTYQGQLKYNGQPVSGPRDLNFLLFDSLEGGNFIGRVDLQDIELVDGLFTVELDFGDTAFNGQPRWLEVQIPTPGRPTILRPRQPITAAPYALYAFDGAGGGSGGELTLPYVGSTDQGQMAFSVMHTDSYRVERRKKQLMGSVVASRA